MIIFESMEVSDCIEIYAFESYECFKCNTLICLCGYKYISLTVAVRKDGFEIDFGRKLYNFNNLCHIQFENKMDTVELFIYFRGHYTSGLGYV